ncbi:MAG: hypothetical protein ACYDAY_08675 [Candidatus Dormibacteria bacterium]
MRYPILYAERAWQRWRFWAGLLFVFYVGLAGAAVLHSRRLDGNSGLYALEAVAVVGLILLIYAIKEYSFVQPRETGVLVSSLVRRTLIPWEAVRAVRVQSLRHAFTDKRSGFARGPVKPLLDTEAIFIRVDNDTFAALRKRLGPREAFENQVALPVSRADELAGELSAHIGPRADQRSMPTAQRRRRRR